MEENQIERIYETHRQNRPVAYRYISYGITAATILTCMFIEARFLAENLENSKSLQATLPIVMGLGAIGCIYVGKASSTAAKGLAKKLF